MIILPTIKTVPAKYHGPQRSKGGIKWIVLHTAESSEMGTSAEAVANYFASGKVKASAHYDVDSDSIVRGVQDSVVAWAAPGANAQGLQIEMAGRAAQTAKEWADPYSLAELELAAKLVGWLCIAHHIPVMWRRGHDLTLGLAGITTHVEVNNAFHQSTHTDPGPNFPASWFIHRVQTLVTG